ncbi:hypothetical protein M0812_14131 [Anaeramoeba flamelloides]|uniref:BTB domain-containing protein n=1 Tax=Anaeramoeba flamelloides TaxID=1746091 RepID=A0AAV7ZJH3_9EUKA|nr:hypothetical protein M0812_14131 [Anaeramoeba flamelloides]
MNKNKSQFCQLCKINKDLDIIEDLDHFLWNCPAYENNRKIWISELEKNNFSLILNNNNIYNIINKQDSISLLALVDNKKEILTNEEIENIKLFFKWIYGNRPKQSEFLSISHIFEKINIQFFDLNFKKTFLNDLSNLYKDNNSKDFTIKIKEELSDESSNESSNESFNESIKVHKIILLIRSELFRNMFNSIEDKNITSIFDYSGKSYETLKCLINYFYTDKLVFKDGDDPDLICEELEDAIEYFQLNIKSNLKQLIKNDCKIIKFYLLYFCIYFLKKMKN